MPEQWPERRFDLIVISEVAYYLDPKVLEELIELALLSLAPDGQLLACHWRAPIEGCALTGDEVHALLHNALGWPRLAQHVEDDFILEVWGRDPMSVASLEGLR